ncbi:MAG: hypothetical protein C0467_21685 [Planctomycetaceae bacterium]|nr:hypothetical protein [Planctomycetaceae bacterium]
MTNRENQKRLDRLAMEYLTAAEFSDFDTIEAFWTKADSDPELQEMLHALNAELAVDQDRNEQNAIGEQIIGAIEKHMPSAEVLRPEPTPLTVATVAEYLRKNPPRGLTVDELRLNDVLRGMMESLPTDLGVPQVVAWGRRFGKAPESYWKAFRAAALKLLAQVESAENYQMAARPGKPKPTEGTP